MQKLACGKLLL